MLFGMFHTGEQILNTSCNCTQLTNTSCLLLHLIPSCISRRSRVNCLASVVRFQICVIQLVSLLLRGVIQLRDHLSLQTFSAWKRLKLQLNIYPPSASPLSQLADSFVFLYLHSFCLVSLFFFFFYIGVSAGLQGWRREASVVDGG